MKENEHPQCFLGKQKGFMFRLELARKYMDNMHIYFTMSAPLCATACSITFSNFRGVNLTIKNIQDVWRNMQKHHQENKWNLFLTKKKDQFTGKGMHQTENKKSTQLNLVTSGWFK